ncbi:43527_t:CDS:2 [Gigaspora margarita]|uniref:43527_t:CDS:1 n=1 Tax=Gigaspora margarita TaxID=4874 RepID=A0ABN7UVL9_GIGMA|nr:43527_t:CDS:2 [Gigaspora margarita]
MDHIKDSQGHKESYKSNSALDSSKKAKTDFIFNISFNEYTNVINAVKSIQQDNKSAHTDVLDFRKENIFPIPDYPCAKSFFSTDKINYLIIITRSAIQEEKKHISKLVKSFLEALLLSEIVSLRLLAKECNIQEDVTDKNTIKNHLENVDTANKAMIYVEKCIEDT